MARPVSLTLPSWNRLWAQGLAQSQGQEAMYCTEAKASTGITETTESQAAQAAREPTREPWV